MASASANQRRKRGVINEISAMAWRSWRSVKISVMAKIWRKRQARRNEMAENIGGVACYFLAACESGSGHLWRRLAATLAWRKHRRGKRHLG
jgi:hypothetical protein